MKLNYNTACDDLQTDLMGQSVYTLMTPEDSERFKHYIGPSDDMPDGEWRKYFNMNFRRAGPRNEPPVYEMVNIMGMQRPHVVRVKPINGKELVQASSSSSNDVSTASHVEV